MSQSNRLAGMKSVRLRFTPGDGQLHPMHGLVIDHEALGRTGLHH